jgi:hypothetical protein
VADDEHDDDSGAVRGEVVASIGRCSTCGASGRLLDRQCSRCRAGFAPSLTTAEILVPRLLDAPLAVRIFRRLRGPQAFAAFRALFGFRSAEIAAIPPSAVSRKRPPSPEAARKRRALEYPFRGDERRPPSSEAAEAEVLDACLAAQREPKDS